MKKSIVAVTIAAGLMAYGCGSGSGGDDDFFGGGGNPLPTGSFTVTPTTTPTNNPGDRSIEVSVVQRSPLLRVVPSGQLLYRNVSVTGEALQNQRVVITSTIEGEAVFLSDPSWVLSNGDKTLTLTLEGADTQAIALAMSTLRARATDSGLGVQVTTQVALDGGLGSAPIISVYYTGNSGALALQVAPSGEVTNLENGNIVSASGGFPAAITAVQAVTSGNDVNHTEGRGSGIYFLAGTHTSSAAATEVNAYVVPSGDGDLNELLVAGPNAFRSASASGLGLVGAQPRLPEAVLERNWSDFVPEQALVTVDAPSVTVVGLEFHVTRVVAIQSRRVALSFGGLDGNVATSRFIASEGLVDDLSACAVRSAVDSVDVEECLIQRFATGVELAGNSSSNLSRNLIIDHTRGVLFTASTASATISNNVFDRGGDGAAFMFLGSHVDFSAALNANAVTFENNDLYRNEPPTPSPTPLAGTWDFIARAAQTGVMITQSNNYTNDGVLLLGNSSFLNSSNFANSDISVVAQKNYPNYARP